VYRLGVLAAIVSPAKPERDGEFFRACGRRLTGWGLQPNQILEQADQESCDPLSARISGSSFGLTMTRNSDEDRITDLINPIVVEITYNTGKTGLSSD
jgi:hypothetical protein